jgi:hypothetical protein
MVSRSPWTLCNPFQWLDIPLRICSRTLLIKDSCCDVWFTQGRGRYVNHVVIQQNPVIMQETDKTVRVECTFDASDQTVSYAPSGTRDQEGGGISVS